MARNTPRVSGTEAPSPWEIFQKRSSDWIEDTLGQDFLLRLQDVQDFITDNIFIITGIIIFLVLFTWFIKHQKKKQNQILELWQWILFFLTKRQMMIPLIITLAKKQSIITPSTQKTLLKIKKECQLTSLKRHPKQRLSVEEKVSHVLQEFFFKTEAAGILERDPRLQKIGKDLMFFDEKLVELQKMYSYQTKKWNNSTRITTFGWFFKPFGIHKLIPFK